MTTMTATYSPDDNKLRLYASSRLDAETYARVRDHGFRWAPKQDLFVAPTWTPERAAFLIELCGEIDDDDISLVDRAEERAERFDEYSAHRLHDYESAHKAISAIADNIPLGQPILVGHHSEKHGRKDAERIENGMRRAVKMWDTAKYWQERAAGAIGHAKYKERPDVRARRIKRLEADLRKVQRTVTNCEHNIKRWNNVEGVRITGKPEATRRQIVVALANADGGYYDPAYTHPSGYVGPLTLWAAAGGNIDGEDHETRAIATCEQIAAKAIENHERWIAQASPWLAHYENRLVYERAMLADAGGTVADRTGPEQGGACRCWASPRGGWSYIQKVNKVTVTVPDNWGNGGPNITRTIPFDKLGAIMTAAQVQQARHDGRLIETGDKTGFTLTDAPAPKPKTEEAAPPPDVQVLRDALRAGVQVAVASQLFPTPRELAERVADAAEVGPGHDVLEPSAGTGMLIGAVGAAWHGTGGHLAAVEINVELCRRLAREFPLSQIHCADFLSVEPDGLCSILGGDAAPLGRFDRIVMNPPFERGADVKHVEHALRFLRPGGRLVAIMERVDLNGHHQVRVENIEDGAFKDAGTNVRTDLVVIESHA